MRQQILTTGYKIRLPLLLLLYQSLVHLKATYPQRSIAFEDPEDINPLRTNLLLTCLS